MDNREGLVSTRTESKHVGVATTALVVPQPSGCGLEIGHFLRPNPTNAETVRKVRNPNGVVSQSPGLLYSATLGEQRRASPTPTGLRRFSDDLAMRSKFGY